MNSLSLFKFSPLPLRILVGIGLILHGVPKITDAHSAEGFFSSVGLPPELAIPIGLLEVIGGIFILTGILTRISAGLIAIEMIGAVLNVKLGKGFIGGYELELLIVVICLSLFISGPGRFSIEYEILRREIFPKGKKIINELKYSTNA
jgi:putative oxidoreductase